MFMPTHMHTSTGTHLVERYPQEALAALHLAHHLYEAVGNQVDHLHACMHAAREGELGSERTRCEGHPQTHSHTAHAAVQASTRAHARANTHYRTSNKTHLDAQQGGVEYKVATLVKDGVWGGGLGVGRQLLLHRHPPPKVDGLQLEHLWEQQKQQGAGE